MRVSLTLNHVDVLKVVCLFHLMVQLLHFGHDFLLHLPLLSRDLMLQGNKRLWSTRNPPNQFRVGGKIFPHVNGCIARGKHQASLGIHLLKFQDFVLALRFGMAEAPDLSCLVSNSLAAKTIGDWSPPRDYVIDIVSVDVHIPCGDMRAVRAYVDDVDCALDLGRVRNLCDSFLIIGDLDALRHLQLELLDRPRENARRFKDEWR
mmetsp:Transcript_33004/g.53052  ORF Transcript_33004/g.53052 Transcript_33004/m.53052 type:complete len:205 (+) Transcript_33004:296-910(+)